MKRIILLAMGLNTGKLKKKETVILIFYEFSKFSNVLFILTSRGLNFISRKLSNESRK